MIFRVFKLYRNVQEGAKNPTGFARDEALGLLRTAIILPTLIGAVLVVLFYLLGYSSFWFGPSGFFKVMSIIMSISWIGWFFITRIILAFAKQVLRRAKQKIDSEIYHDVTPK
jgi:hypothetical protein